MHMRVRDEAYRLPDGSTETRRVYETIHGPAITEVKPGVDAVAALKWYGTLPDDQIFDESAIGFYKLNRVRSVQEGIDAGRHFGLIGQNLVLADVDGAIGWHAFGAAPLRKGYSGRLPAAGSDGVSDWTGYLPYETMPSAFNPAQGWIATANHRSTPDNAEHPLTYDWCAPYRYERITQTLQAMKAPTPDSFRRLQLDVHSLQADRLIPKLAAYNFTDDKARLAQKMLLSWDREVGADSAGAVVYEVFLTEWVRALLEDELGKDLKFYLHLLPAAYLAHDVILDRPNSPLWDRVDTPVKETPREILELALKNTMTWLDDHRLGGDATKWRWGRVHHYYFAHPGAKSRIEHSLLSRGPFPAPGDNTTVNAACFDPSLGSYGTIVIPSLRVIAPLSDLDRTMIAGPMGQSGQPGHPHYDDLIEPWMSAEGVPLYFSRTAVEANAASRLVLTP